MFFIRLFQVSDQPSPRDPQYVKVDKIIVLKIISAHFWSIDERIDLKGLTLSAAFLYFLSKCDVRFKFGSRSTLKYSQANILLIEALPLLEAVETYRFDIS